MIYREVERQVFEGHLVVSMKVGKLAEGLVVEEDEKK